MSRDAEDAAPYAFRAPLAVCLDVRHPQAYLALAPVQSLAAELGIAVEWLPFPVRPPQGPPPVTAGDDRGTRHRRARALFQARDVAVHAGLQGLTIEQPFRTGDATAASLGHPWLRDRAPEVVPAYLARLFERFWRGSLDAASSGAIAGLLSELGQPAAEYERFAGGAGPAELESLRAALVAAGVFTVPSLVAAGEVFVGRAHLPMVRWLLTDRAGPPPI